METAAETYEIGCHAGYNQCRVDRGEISQGKADEELKKHKEKDKWNMGEKIAHFFIETLSFPMDGRRYMTLKTADKTLCELYAKGKNEEFENDVGKVILLNLEDFKTFIKKFEADLENIQEIEEGVLIPKEMVYRALYKRVGEVNVEP